MLLGLIHLVYTLHGAKLIPRGRDLQAHSTFLFRSTFLLSLGLLLGGYVFLGKRYWFSVPFRGILWRRRSM